MNLKRFIIKAKHRYQRGLSWVNHGRDAILLAIMFKVFGIDIIWIIPLGITYFITTLLIGYIDYQKGIWLAENDYYFYELSPYRKRQYDRIEKIYNYVNNETDNYIDNEMENFFDEFDEAYIQLTRGKHES